MAGTLVIRPEKLGDLVVSTPVFKALKTSFPSEPLHLLTDDIYSEVVRFDPHVDKIIPVKWRGRNRPQRESWMAIRQKLAGTSYSRAAILYYNVEAFNWVVFSLGIRQVAQLGGTLSGIALGHKMVLRKGHVVRKHFAECYLDVAKELGATVHDTYPKLYVKPEEVDELGNRFPSLRDGHRKVILHPYGHGSSPNFSIESYADVARELSALPDVRVFITGGANEAHLWPQLDLPHIDTSLLGCLSPREWIAASSMMDLVIAGSTGVIHAAAAVGAKTLGLYCPFVGSHPDIWGPRSLKSTNLIAPEKFCKKIGPCNSLCTGQNDCNLARAISPREVAEATKNLLR